MISFARLKHLTALVLMNMVFAISAFSQKNTQWGLDVFPLDAKAHVLFNANSDFPIGLDAEIGVNFSNYILLAGSHFSDKFTLIPYQSKDAFGNERYYGLFGFGVFTRMREDTNLPLDLGLRGEFFIHRDDSDDDVGSGFFTGAYVQAYKTIKHKNKDGKEIRKISIGVRGSMGVFKEFSIKEFAVLTDFWLRFHL